MDISVWRLVQAAEDLECVHHWGPLQEDQGAQERATEVHEDGKMDKYGKIDKDGKIDTDGKIGSDRRY